VPERQLSADAPAPRILPPLTDLNRPFWTGGANGELLIQRCAECRRWTHPPVEQCAACGGALAPEAVRGTGTVFTYTENFQQFHPDVPPPYLIGIVVLDEQDDLRLPTNIVHVDPSTIECGTPVKVLFEPQGEYFVPLFEPLR
jgi:uncharacterized OB-fold protein